MAPGATGERTDIIRSFSPTDDDDGAEPEVDERRAAAEAIADSSQPEKLEAEVHRDALDWLLSDEPDEYAYEKFEIDVAPPGSKDPVWLVWTLRALNADELKAARRLASGANRQQRRKASGEEADLSEINLRIVTLATVAPDLHQAAQAKGYADPSHVLKHRFRNKPGIIDQLASKVLTISGYEEEAIRDAVEVRAAGN